GNPFANGDSLTFNDAVQHPVVTVTDGAGTIITDANVTYADANGNAVSSKWTGSYSVKISIDTSKYAIDGACSDVCEYVIVVDANGNGDYKIISIEVGGNYKKNYSTGDSFDSYGMVVYGIYPDGEKVELNSNDYTYSGGGALVEGDNTITVNYGDLSATFIVKAGQLVDGGILSLDDYVTKRNFMICMVGVIVLIVISIILCGVIISLARRIPKPVKDKDIDSVQDTSVDENNIGDD
ncbi:MAG: bacterial Ig-like domain-containing protein, partial [Clostridia bacterium]|nr:bacterial Ig-like domain-containing protein [Clostridia bacterium]